MLTRVQAKEDILIPKPGQVGAFELAYKEGDYIREEDIPALEALGVDVSGAKKAAKPPPEDKAERGPRETPKKTRASRDKKLTGPKEEE